MIQDKDLELPEDLNQLVNQFGQNMNEFTAQYEHDERFKDIMMRIRNFISKYFSQKFYGSTIPQKYRGTAKVHFRLYS